MRDEAPTGRAAWPGLRTGLCVLGPQAPTPRRFLSLTGGVRYSKHTLSKPPLSGRRTGPQAVWASVPNGSRPGLRPWEGDGDGDAPQHHSAPRTPHLRMPKACVPHALLCILESSPLAPYAAPPLFCCWGSTEAPLAGGHVMEPSCPPCGPGAVGVTQGLETGQG